MYLKLILIFVQSETKRNKLQLNFNQNTIFFIYKHAYENNGYEMVATLSMGGDELNSVV